jgi:hypothetical protein
MNERHEHCDTVFQCLNETPYYETMSLHFQVSERDLQQGREHRGCFK